MGLSPGAVALPLPPLPLQTRMVRKHLPQCLPVHVFVVDDDNDDNDGDDDDDGDDDEHNEDDDDDDDGHGDDDSGCPNG